MTLTTPRTGIVVLCSSLLFASGCVSNRHLVFFTNTTLGVEIAAEPNATTPAKFIVGYKRAEGVIDPIGNDTSSPPTGSVNLLSPEGHSVLAKLNFGASGAGSSASNAQWFATGEAARRLSQAPGIAGAISGDDKIAVAAAQQTTFALGATPDTRLSRLALLNSIHDDLADLGKTDPAAAALVVRLDQIDVSADAPEFLHYGVSGLIAGSGPGSGVVTSTQKALSKGHELNAAIAYHARLSESVDVLRTHLEPFDENLKVQSGDTLVAATPAFVATASKDLASQKALLAAFDKKMSQDPATIAATSYFSTLLLVSNSK